MRFIFAIFVMVMVLTGCNVEQPVSKVESGNDGNEQQEEQTNVPNQVF